jgi:hypothetical protein
VGNPGLKPSFSNQVALTFFDFKIFSERSISASLSYGFTQNSISDKSTVDSSGRRISQAINVNGNRSVSGNLNYGFKWKGPDLNLSLYTTLNNSRSVSMVNELPNTTNSNNYSFGFMLGKFKEKVYDISLRATASYTQSQSSINTRVSTNYWTYNINEGLDIFLPAHFQLHADADINLRQKTAVFNTNNSTILMNAWAGRKFLKNDALLVKISGNDLFNQNIGFSRTVNSNFISQNTYSTIQRNFMLSVVWNFTRSVAPPAPVAGRTEP